DGVRAADGATLDVGGPVQGVALVCAGRRARSSSGPWRPLGLDERPRAFELGRRVARGHQAEGADLDEAIGPYGVGKPTEEGIWREGDGLAVLGPEGDAVLVHRHEAMVGNPDTMGVAAEVSNHLLGATEGALGVDIPAHAVESSAQVLPRLRIGRRTPG